jgi:hypothetical protein
MMVMIMTIIMTKTMRMMRKRTLPSAPLAYEPPWGSAVHLQRLQLSTHRWVAGGLCRSTVNLHFTAMNLEGPSTGTCSRYINAHFTAFTCGVAF